MSLQIEDVLPELVFVSVRTVIVSFSIFFFYPSVMETNMLFGFAK